MKVRSVPKEPRVVSVKEEEEEEEEEEREARVRNETPIDKSLDKSHRIPAA